MCRFSSRYVSGDLAACFQVSATPRYAMGFLGCAQCNASRDDDRKDLGRGRRFSKIPGCVSRGSHVRLGNWK